MKTLLYLLLIILLNISNIEPRCQSGCEEPSSLRIDVHVIPHSQMDLNWLYDFEKYYYTTKTFDSDALPGVQYILSSVVGSLSTHPRRRFALAEVAYFWKWWNEQNDNMKQKVRELVENGQLEFVNGGWAINDEATTNYHATINQFTLGARILNDTIGECARPKIGWQIDTFGHSREEASIIHQMGLNGLVIERLDYRDKKKRLNHNLEFDWITSNSLDSKLFTTLFPKTQNSERDFCFDISCRKDLLSPEAIVSDPESPDYNVEKIKETFLLRIKAYKEFYQTKNLMIPVGGNFYFSAAEYNFINWDKLIAAFKNDTEFNVFYSTPSCYVQAVKAEIAKKKIKLPIKENDFFPIASETHAFWTGYYSARPNLKGFERKAQGILQSVKQLALMSRLDKVDIDKNIFPLILNLNILQHHDSITGTSPQVVINKLIFDLTKSIYQIVKAVQSSIWHLLKRDLNSKIDLPTNFCFLSNISICEESTKDKFLVIVQNPLGQTINSYIQLPVDKYNYKITGPDGNEKYDIFPSISNFEYVKELHTPSKSNLVFLAKNLPALGLKLYYIEKSDVKKNVPVAAVDRNFIFGDNNLGFTVEDCQLSSVTIKNTKLEIKQQFEYYNSASYYMDQFEQASDHYIFRPNGQFSNSLGSVTSCTQFKGELVEEFHQKFTENHAQIIRIYKNDEESYLEFDWLVGNLPVKMSNGGTEVITKFIVSNFKSLGFFATDTNGRETIQRQVDFRPDYTYNSSEEPVASNFYPVTSKIEIVDKEKNLKLVILNDRAQGGTSLVNGQIELMIHRRILGTDISNKLGFAETLNEMEYKIGTYVRGKHYLVFGSNNPETSFMQGKNLAVFSKKLALKKRLSPLVLLSDGGNKLIDSLDTAKKNLNFKVEILNQDLPENVHILSFESWLNSYLLRLEHFIEKDSDPHLSQSVIVNLKELFAMFDITEIYETTLSANRFLDKDEGIACNDIPQCDKNLLKIKLNPMQIRTFIFKTNKNNDGGVIYDFDGNDSGPDDNGSTIWRISAVLVLSSLSIVFVV